MVTVEVRRRKAPKERCKGTHEQSVIEEDKKIIRPTIGKGTFWLTRIVFLRSLGFIYLVAFLIALDQNKELIGDKGLLPLRLFLSRVKANVENNIIQKALTVPTLLWICDPWDHIDWVLDGIAYAGIIISFVILITGAANALALMILWVLYHSIVNVGQRWYAFGWESQLLETGFLAVWIVPWFSWRPLPERCPPSKLAVFGYRWLIMRIMIGAGLIKIRGDQCWRDFTCMFYFYETQPLPNPVSYYAHLAPEWWHKFEVFGNHVVELVFPFFTLLPFRWAAMTNGFLQVVFQLMLISTGNFSFLNWITILPSIWYFDDRTFSFFFSKKWLSQSNVFGSTKSVKNFNQRSHEIAQLLVGFLIIFLSWPIVLNLVSQNQIMNTSFEPLRIVNTYGAFGSVTKKRTEIVFEGTYSDDPSSPDAQWIEYEFKCKPGSTDRPPCLISPYHHRLDWLMWFAAFQNYEANPWLVHLAGKMLENDETIDSLLEHNPFSKKTKPPTFVRALHYRYRFTDSSSSEASRGHWWSRNLTKTYLPPVSLKVLKPVYEQFGWEMKHTT